MMHRAIRLTAAVLFGLATLAACGGDSGTVSQSGTTSTTNAADPVAGTSWTLASYMNAADRSVPAAPGANATLAFADGNKINGSTGCNQFGGTYTIDGAKLTIELGAMTQVACAGAFLTAQEAAITEGMPLVAGFTQDSSGLTLTAADGSDLFKYSAGLTGLEGTAWVATGVNNGNGAVESNALTEKLTASFGADGAFSGFGGCNDLTGKYEATTDTLSITGLASTQKACADDVSKLETQYMAALTATTTYEITGDVLTLKDDGGATQATFKLSG
jgi:heat shock protein HslJ